MEVLDFLVQEWKTIVLIVGILTGAAIFAKVIRWLIKKSFKAAEDKIDDPTRYKFFMNAASAIIWIIAIAAVISMIPKLKALAITLFAGAGILVAIIGFAAQQAFANIVGGIFIVISKPFRVGDMVKVGSLDYGIVEDITLRHTVINSFENKRIIVPNAVVNSETIVNDNIEDQKVCRWIEFGISYDSNADLATKIIQEEAMKHPRCIDVRTKEQKKAGEPQVAVRMVSLGDFSVNLRAYVWIDDPNYGIATHSDINRAVKKRFDKEGIEIPFPYRTVVYKKDLPPNAPSYE